MNKIDEKITDLKAKLKALEAEQKAQKRVTRQTERSKARKVENNSKFALGGLIKLAGLFETDRGALLGALLIIPPLLADPEKFAAFKQVGDALLARRERERNYAAAGTQSALNEGHLQ